jgi:hypothetical protein
MFPACTVFAYTMLEFFSNLRDAIFPDSNPAHLTHPVVRLPPSKVVLHIHPSDPTPSASSSTIAVAGSVFLVFSVIIICLARWFFQCAARSKANSQSTPSLSSLPAGRGEREEPQDEDADFDELDYEPSEGEDDEADGDGDDYPGDDLDAELDELKEEARDALSSPEDPPPPPDPPTQTAAADPDSNAKGVPLWYLLFLALFSMTAFSLLRWSFLRIRRSLGRIKVYTGSSIFNLFIYVEDPTCRGLVRTAAVSSLAGGAGFAAPFQLEDYDTVRQAVELDNAALLEVLVLPPVLKIAGALVVLAVGVLIDMRWRAREAEDGELVIFFSNI